MTSKGYAAKDYAVVFAALGVLFAVAGWWIYAPSGPSQGPGNRLLVPDGYRGWLIVEWDSRGAPPLKVINGRYDYAFSPNGYLKTSSELDQRWQSLDEAYFHSDRGRARVRCAEDFDNSELRDIAEVAVWGGDYGIIGGAPAEDIHVSIYYIGTPHQYRVARQSGEPGIDYVRFVRD
jgi:hypothetical protein